MIGPWVQDYLRMKDDKGGYQHYKYAGALADQPAFDMDFFDIIRSKWIKLMNAEQERQMQKMRLG